MRTLENGLGFWCPGCKEIHFVDDRWTFNGDYDKPTITPSIKVTWFSGPEHTQHVCHSNITAGQIQMHADCTHELAGQTRELFAPEWPKD